MLLVYGIEVKHTIMDMELSKYMNVDLNWNIEKKGRRNTTRRPRKPGVDLGTKIQDAAAFETKKILDAPSKKRRVLHQSPSPPCLETSCLPPGPQTPSIHYEDPSQRCYNSSVSQTKKTKSKTRLRNKSNKSIPTKMVDFSGLHLLADVACSTFLLDHFSESKEETTPEVNPSTVDIKETTIISMESDGTEEENAPLKGLRLHWDLNTVPDEWEAPSDDKVLVEPHSPQKSSEGVKSASEGLENMNADVSIVPVSGSCNEDSLGKTSELTEELTGSKEVMGTKTKTSECGSKSEDVGVVSEEISQPVCESPNYSSDKKSSSEECGSNVTSSHDEQEGGQIGEEEEDTIDKVEVGYDSPFEDGELREPKKDTLSYDSDNNTCKDDLGTIENPKSEEKVVDHGQTSLSVKEAIVPNNHVVVKVEESDCASEKEITETKNTHQLSKHVTRNYGNIENSYSRSWRDSKSSHEYYRPNSYTRDYYTPRDGYRGVQNRRPSPSERNNGYVPNRYRYHSQEYHDPKPSYVDRKVRCYSPKRQSRSRSRSGSPIAWNFQKRKHSDVTQSVGHVSSEPSSKRDSMTWRKPIGYYPDRLKSDNHFRYTERDSGRFSREHKYDADGIRKHDGHHEKVTRDAANSIRR